MIITIIIVLLSLLLASLVWKMIRGSRGTEGAINRWEQQKREINIEALRLLLDSREDEYLRRSLPKGQFRQLHRKRIAAARKLLADVDINTVLLMKIGEFARSGANRKLAEPADELVRTAVRTRLNILCVRFYLTIKWLLPSVRVTVPIELPRYSTLIQQLASVQEDKQIATP